MIYDYVIIGAGISGMNLGLKLKEKFRDKSILIVEAHTIFGGRIQTIYENNINFDSGAARFNDNHVLLKGLIKKYKLENDMINIPSSWDTKYLGRKYSSKFKTVDNLLNALIKKYKKISKKTKLYLQSKNIIEICEENFGKKEADFLAFSHPYYSELFVLNAYDALISLKQDLNETLKFYILSKGLSQVTNSMFIESKLKKINYKFNTKFIGTEFNQEENIFKSSFIDLDKNTIYFNSKNLIFAIDGFAFQKLNLSNLNEYITEKDLTFENLQSSINTQPLLRTFAKFKRGKDQLWTDKIPKTVTNDKLRYVIPIGNGVVMISYTDGRHAKYWLNKMNNNTQQDLVLKSIKKLFPNEKISDNPLFFKNYYWHQGASYWEKNIDSEKYIKIFEKPTKLNLFICGDSYSNRQAWVEGALESSNNVFERIYELNN